MNNENFSSALQKAMDNSEYIGRIKAQNEVLKLVWELNKQGRISNDVAQVFALELSLDLPPN
jgi:hypothetical protein